jgi:hypothetical protein
LLELVKSRFGDAQIFSQGVDVEPGRHAFLETPQS